MTGAYARLRARTFAIPLLVGVLGLTGLLAALVSDGAGHAVSWVTLGLPIALAAERVLRHAPPPDGARQRGGSARDPVPGPDP